jgi:prepilin-type processing-associated H-X9-DG protein/prepilin-type N-terminal cleavage/methylation domain-containing protein
MKSDMNQNQSTAFTLIELLIVIAITAIIAAILFPVFARVREKARQTTCLSNQKQIASAVLMYMGDNDETFPFVLDWSANFSMASGANTGDDGKQPLVRGVTGQEPQFQLVNVVALYVKNANIWYCPSVGPDYAWEAPISAGVWKQGARMGTQGTSYFYSYIAYPSRNWSQQTFMGGKSGAILREPSRWPMIFDQPSGVFTGNIADPPASAVPHSGGLNVAYGDGHAKFHRLEAADGTSYNFTHAGDGLYPGQ